jgi:pantoate--beta-alanine ligase
MKTIHEVTALRAELAALRRDGKVAFVPTMGNLHAGHLALVRRARRHTAHVVASIFVNPLQFGANEDLDSYPRTLQQDRQALEAEGVSLLFAPTVAVMYPVPLEQHTRVEVPGLSGLYCGASRPGHFEGVATVVCKLFNMVQPDVAVFGKKDFQQLLVIRRMVRDLCMPVEIVGLDTVREPDGLAMSSRNQYLLPAERDVAPQLYQALCDTAQRIASGKRDYAALLEDLRAQLVQVGFHPDYIEVADSRTLLPPTEQSDSLVILAAAWLGAARLIDNIEVDLRSPAGA